MNPADEMFEQFLLMTNGNNLQNAMAGLVEPDERQVS
jgi:hypothetical protein